MRKAVVTTSWIVIGLSVAIMVALPSPGDEDGASCDSDWRNCEDLQAFINSASDGLIHAQADCKTAAERRAQYGDPRWGYGFAHVVPAKSNLDRGRVQLMAKDAEFQNGFGAWRKTNVVCTYDLERETVTNLSVGG